MTPARLILTLALLPALIRAESDYGSAFSDAAGSAVLARSGDLAGAAEAADEALRKYEGAYGPHHALSAAARRNAGLAAWHQGLYAKAEAALVQALGASLSLGPDGAAQALEIQLDLACLFASSGRPALAGALFEAVLERAAPPLLLEVAQRYARFSASNPASSTAPARARATAALESELQRRKKDDPVTLAPWHADQACLLFAAGSKDAAGILWARALPGLERHTGLLSYDSLPRHEAYAFALFQSGDKAGAGRAYARVLEFRRKILGEKHPDTTALASFLKKNQADPLKTSPAP